MEKIHAMTRLNPRASRGSQSDTMMRRLFRNTALSRGLLAATALALVSAAATPALSETDAAASIIAESGTADGLPVTLSGSYLSGRLAGQTNDLANAAAFFAEALEADPGNTFLLDRAFVLQLANGNIEEALDLAERLRSEQPDHFVAGLLLAADALRHGKPVEADKLLAKGGRGPLAELAGGLVAAWAKEAEGNTDAALAQVSSLDGPSWFTVFLTYHAGLIQDHAGRTKDALENFRAAYDTDKGALRVVDAYARSLAKNGQKDEALKVLAEYDRVLPDHPVMRATRKALESNEKIGPIAGDAKVGSAEVLYGLGAAIGRDGGEELAAVFLQLALHLDPKADVAAVALAGLFDRLGRFERSIGILENLSPDSPLKRDAEIQIALNYNALEDLEQSRAHLEALVAKDPTQYEAVVALGNVLRSHKLFAECEEAYSRGIDTIDKPEEKHWTIFYFRGICRERQNKWDAAEADLGKALELSPDQPLVLNYLGYSLVDRGLKLPEALEMIRTAVELRPKDGYIVDSLGWVYFRLGRYDEAVVELERAVELRPEDPVINDHLGDGYWMVGRKLEARFQWNHARDLGAEPDDLVTILDKIENGLKLPQGTPAAHVEPKKNGG